MNYSPFIRKAQQHPVVGPHFDLLQPQLQLPRHHRPRAEPQRHLGGHEGPLGPPWGLLEPREGFEHPGVGVEQQQVPLALVPKAEQGQRRGDGGDGVGLAQEEGEFTGTEGGDGGAQLQFCWGLELGMGISVSVRWGSPKTAPQGGNGELGL